MTIHCCVFLCPLATVCKIITFFLIPLHPAVNQTAEAGAEAGAETGAVGSDPNYIAFVLVPVFFVLGLLGVVICHVLKRKGYRCTTETQDGEEEECQEEKDSELGGGKKI